MPAPIGLSYEDLRAYTGPYLQMEVQAEARVRGIQAFSRFLAVAGAGAGEQINFEQVASDAAVPTRSGGELSPCEMGKPAV